MKKVRTFTGILLLAMVLAACAQVSTPQKSTSAAHGDDGTAAGIPPGLIIGRDTDPARIDAAIDGVLGTILSRSMTGVDREKLVNVYEYNPDLHTSKWINDQSGNEFSATPVLTYADEKSGLGCREVEIISIVNGTIDQARSTACRKDGRWYFH